MIQYLTFLKIERTFGEGGSTYYGSGGGGGGYFGGGAGKTFHDQVGSGAGGSSYISGYPESRTIDEYATQDNPKTTENPNHFSGYVFKNPKISTWTSSDRNLGNGYVTIIFHLKENLQKCNNFINFSVLLFIFILYSKF